jgi:DNA-binding beta-propeller fold protein YncE
MASENSPGHGLFVMPDASVGAKFTDTLVIDQETHLLYMGDNWSGGVDVFDVSTPHPELRTTVRMRGSLFGLCVAKSTGRLFVGLSGSACAVVDIDPSSPTLHTLVARIDTGGHGNTDLLDFDPVREKIYAANRNEGFIVAIDAKSNAVVARIDGLGGGLEQPCFNPVDGMLYLAGNTDNVLYQIDPERDVLVATFDIVDACNPNGMAINPETNQAILACGNRDRPHTVVWDFNSQAVAQVIEETGAGDGAIYSGAVDRFFFAAANFTTGPVMGIFSGDPVRFLGNVKTGRAASWVAFDETNNIVYAPTIDAGKPALLSFTIPLFP